MFNLDKLGSWASGMGDWMSLVQKFQNDEQFKNLLTSPAFQELIKDPEVVDAIQSKNYLKLMGMPKMQGFLKDPEVQKALQNMGSSK